MKTEEALIVRCDASLLKFAGRALNAGSQPGLFPTQQGIARFGATHRSTIATVTPLLLIAPLSGRVLQIHRFALYIPCLIILHFLQPLFLIRLPRRITTN